jgi:hypothetical protein
MTQIPELDRSGLRSFGLTFGAIIAVLFGLLLPWLFSYSFPWWPWLIGTVFTVWALAAPKSLRPVYVLWMKIGLVINAVVTRIILGTVFYLIVLPTGFILRLRGGDPMRRELDKDMTTYRVQSHRSPPEQMQRPF